MSKGDNSMNYPDIGQHPEDTYPTHRVIIEGINAKQLDYQIKALHNLSGTVPYELEGAINLLEAIKDNIKAQPMYECHANSLEASFYRDQLRQKHEERD